MTPEFDRVNDTTPDNSSMDAIKTAERDMQKLGIAWLLALTAIVGGAVGGAYYMVTNSTQNQAAAVKIPQPK